MLTPEVEEHIEELLESCDCRGNPSVVCHRWGCEEVRMLYEEVKRLQLQLERDQSAYALMRKGMESQAELMDGMKQELRQTQKAYKELMSETE